MSPGREQAGQHACTLTGPPQRGHRIAPSIGVDQSFQGLDQLGVMMDQRLSSGPRMPDSLNGEGALRKALDGPIDGRARKTSNTGDDGNTSSSQSLTIEGCNQVLLSLIDVRKQQGVLPLKFFGFAHSRIIPYPPSCVTINFLRALTRRASELGNLRSALNEVMGEENFVAVLVFDRNRKNDAKLFSVGHEYMVVYACNKALL